MKEYRYDINQFYWDKEANHFFARRSTLWNYDYAAATIPFLNEKSQFYIHNPSTGGNRRFRFSHEKNFKSDTVWYFESEDGIGVEILID